MFGTNWIMMMLGFYPFSLHTAAYQSLQRRTQHRWPAQDRAGRSPALQYLGPGAEEITLSGVIHPHFRGGRRQIDLMRLASDQGEPLMLVDGLGFIHGRWVIRSIAETASTFFADGAPRAQQFNISLAAYGEDFFS